MKNLIRGVLLILFALALVAPALQAQDNRYAAIAYSPSTNHWGWGTNYPTKDEAIARAVRSLHLLSDNSCPNPSGSCSANKQSPHNDCLAPAMPAPPGPGRTELTKLRE